MFFKGLSPGLAGRPKTVSRPARRDNLWRPGYFQCYQKSHSFCLYLSCLVWVELVTFDFQELAAMKARVREMEEEAEKLKQLQSEVDKQMSMGSPPSSSKYDTS